MGSLPSTPPIENRIASALTLMAHTSRACARGARRPSDVGQQSDPQSDRPAGAACWPPSPFLEFGLGANDGARAIGATDDDDDDDDAAAAAGRSARFSYGVIAKHAALKLRQFRALTIVIAYTRARAGRGADSSELGQQTDPLEPPGRRCGCWPTSPILFRDFGSRRRM
jgi:hypothetical protein